MFNKGKKSPVKSMAVNDSFHITPIVSKLMVLKRVQTICID